MNIIAQFLDSRDIKYTSLKCVILLEVVFASQLNLSNVITFYTLWQHLDSGLDWREGLEGALRALAFLLRDEKTMSAYEVHLSRLVPVLLHCLTGAQGGMVDRDVANNKEVGSCKKDRARERERVFKKVFSDVSTEPHDDLNSRYRI